jgi:cellulose synthase/poly-beta-1,6-N-acetylglucosamine synthase-like glycosyltransferase
MFFLALRQVGKAGSALNVPVSVIICAHDEEQNLKELVPMLLAQNHPEFELIVVNDRSNDGTYDWLLEETKKHARLKMVHVNFKPEHVNGKKFALTLGIKAARYDWVLLTDADCRPASNEWIHQMAGTFTEKNSLVLGYSPYSIKPGLLNAFIRFETHLTAIQYFSFAQIGFPYMGVGRNMAYRKNLFLNNKGFNKHLGVTGGDDDLFVNALALKEGVTMMISPATIMISKPKTTWQEFWQQKIRHLAVGKFYSAKSKFMLAPFTLSWALFWPVTFSLMVSQFYITLAAVLVRWLLELIVMIRFVDKTGEKLEAWKLPFLDFIFGFYYLVAGFKALFTKRVKWKT